LGEHRDIRVGLRGRGGDLNAQGAEDQRKGSYGSVWIENKMRKLCVSVLICLPAWRKNFKVMVSLCVHVCVCVHLRRARGVISHVAQGDESSDYWCLELAAESGGQEGISAICTELVGRISFHRGRETSVGRSVGRLSFQDTQPCHKQTMPNSGQPKNLFLWKQTSSQYATYTKLA